ncbi:hypothetical protein LIA77_04030 [Sarocladium implicatum]|nr:hypothetical protein LIA77_04030 [Sarocladium implicatum]
MSSNPGRQRRGQGLCRSLPARGIRLRLAAAGATALEAFKVKAVAGGRRTAAYHNCPRPGQVRSGHCQAWVQMSERDTAGSSSSCIASDVFPSPSPFMCPLTSSFVLCHRQGCQNLLLLLILPLLLCASSHSFAFYSLISALVPCQGLSHYLLFVLVACCFLSFDPGLDDSRCAPTLTFLNLDLSADPSRPPARPIYSSPSSQAIARQDHHPDPGLGRAELSRFTSN